MSGRVIRRKIILVFRLKSRVVRTIKKPIFIAFASFERTAGEKEQTDFANESSADESGCQGQKTQQKNAGAVYRAVYARHYTRLVSKSDR